MSTLVAYHVIAILLIHNADFSLVVLIKFDMVIIL